LSPEQAREAENVLEMKVTRIWTLLSAFEESSAACISDMLLHVSNGAYIEGSLMAAKFIIHVEVLFEAIDALDALSMRASGQCNYSKFVINGRPSISKGSKITLPENCQFLFSVEQNIRSRS
jgi:dolichyl-phosphate-mannose--protein O-mannosyl transferase